MTTLTKFSVVFLVILSLLVAAGLVVFVNKADSFKTTILAKDAANQALTSQLATAREDASLQGKIALEARNQYDALSASTKTELATKDATITGLQGQLATAQANLSSAMSSNDNAQQALTASETGKKALSDRLDAVQTANNKLQGDNNSLNLAVSDLTNKLEVAVRQVTNLNETVAQVKEAKEIDDKIIQDNHISRTTEAGLGAGAPPIDGVIRQVNAIGGIPYATISVGSADQVKKGMKFSIVDRQKGEFLGELTIEQVDERTSTGRLEGPKINNIRQDGTIEVKTQL